MRGLFLLYRYLVKQNMRQYAKFFKTHAIFFTVSILSAAISVPFFYQILLSFEPHLYVNQISIALTVLGVVYVFNGKNCCFLIHPATLHFFLHTKQLSKIKMFAFLLVFAKIAALSLVVAVGVFISSLPRIDLLFLLSLFTFFFSCLMLKWTKYKLLSKPH